MESSGSVVDGIYKLLIGRQPSLIDCKSCLNHFFYKNSLKSAVNENVPHAVLAQSRSHERICLVLSLLYSYLRSAGVWGDIRQWQ